MQNFKRKRESNRGLGRKTATQDAAARQTVAANLSRAEALLLVRDAKGAISTARAILRKDRDHVGALEVLARAQWQENAFSELVLTLKHLIRLDPYEHGYRSLLGAAYQCLGLFGEAVKAFASCADLQKDDDQREARLAIVEIQDWQARLVADLLREDAVFRTAYAKDPEAACRARGFEFVAPQPIISDAVVAEASDRSIAATRPS